MSVACMKDKKEKSEKKEKKDKKDKKEKRDKYEDREGTTVGNRRVPDLELLRQNALNAKAKEG